MRVRCYAYSLEDEPFLDINVETVGDMLHEFRTKIDPYKYPNEINVKIGIESSILYDPYFRTFKEWNGYQWINISYNRVYHLFNRA